MHGRRSDLLILIKLFCGKKFYMTSCRRFILYDQFSLQQVNFVFMTNAYKIALYCSMLRSIPMLLEIRLCIDIMVLQVSYQIMTPDCAYRLFLLTICLYRHMISINNKYKWNVQMNTAIFALIFISL